MFKRLLPLAALCISSAVVAGPLGLEMGTPLADLQKQLNLKATSPYIFSTPSLPNGHPDFDDYRLVITPQHGLCRVNAYTPSISTSVYGNELLSKFDDIFRALTKKYGNGKRYDFLRDGSIWRDPNDWTMALLKKERVLAAFWGPLAQNPDNLHAIAFEATGLTREAVMLRLSYEFKNASDCLDWIKAQKDSKL